MNSLIESTGDQACGLTNGSNGNIIGSDPNLDSLTGSPAYFPLNSGSPAIDAGDDAVCSVPLVNNTSQNGVIRPQGSHCDIGAFEYTFPILVMTYKSNAAQDGWVLESTETSGTGGTKNNTATTFNLGDDAANRQYRAILSFDTSSIPVDAVITQVTLKVKRNGVSGGGNPVSIFKGFMVDIKTGTFGTSALALGDFKVKASKTLGPFSLAPSGGWYPLNLTPGSDQINKTGLTQISLRFKLDDNNNSVANLLKLYSGNAGVANRPQLIVEYYVP